MIVQDLDERHIGSTVRIAGREPMKVLGLCTQFPQRLLERVALKVVIGGRERVVEFRQDTEVLDVDI